MSHLTRKLIYAGTVIVLLPLAAYADVAPVITPKCGPLSGLWLSALLVGCGCWLVRSQMRPRK